MRKKRDRPRILKRRPIRSFLGERSTLILEKPLLGPSSKAPPVKEEAVEGKRYEPRRPKRFVESPKPKEHGHLSYLGQSKLDYCVECLPGSTILYTGSSVEKISSFRDAHTVIGHTGEIESIEKTLNRPYSGDLVEVDFWYSNIPLRLTPEHPIYGVRDVREPQSSWRTKGISERFLEWIPAYKLTQRDFIAFPRIKRVRDIGIATGDLMELAGLYIAEGNPDKPARGMHVTFSFGRHEVQLIDSTSNLIRKVFGLEPCITDTDTQTAVRVILSSKYYGPFFEQFGKGARNKTIPEWVLYLPEGKQFRLVRGAIKGDGNKGKFCFTYSTSSIKLAYRLRLLLFRLGILHGLHERDEFTSEIDGRKINGAKFYEIIIGGDAARLLAEKIGVRYDGGQRTSGNFGYVSDNYVFIPVKEVKSVPYEGKVYNLHINDSESYLTVHGALHNCSVKHSQTAKVLMREAVQRAQAGSPSSPGVMEKVRGVVEELCGFEDDTQTTKSEKVSTLNSLSRTLRKFIYAKKAEIGDASLEDLREIKDMVDKLVDATYQVRMSEECIGCFGPNTNIWIPNGFDKISNNVNALLNREMIYHYKRDYRGQMIYIQPKFYSLGYCVTPEHPIWAIKRGSYWYEKEQRFMPVSYGYTKAKNLIGQNELSNEKLVRSSIHCPKCMSKKVWRNGVRKNKSGKVQRYLCGICGRKFSQTTIDPKKRAKIFPKWIPAKDLKENDILVSPIPKRIIKPFMFPKPILRLIGYYIADGCPGFNNRIQIAFNSKKDKTIIEDTKKTVMAYLKVPVQIYVKEDNTTVVCWSHKAFQTWLKNHCGTSSQNKQIPDFLMALPEDQLEELVKGIYLGDGYQNENYTDLHTTSEKLVHQIMFFENSKGKHISLTEGKDGDYHLRCSKSTRHGWSDGKNLYTPIHRVEKRDYAGKVYNFETETQDYLLPYMRVHNCTVEELCGGNLECVEFIEKAAKSVKDPGEFRKILREAREKYRSV